MKTVNIALIDSGVNYHRKEFSRIKIKSIQTRFMNDIDTIGHGTAIAFLFSKLIKSFNLFSFKLFEEDFQTSERDLIRVLNLIYEEYDVDIIHISSGVVYSEKINELYEICQKLTEKGVIIVSAFDNAGAISYPAALSNVIGVYWDPLCVDTKEYIYVKNSVVNVLGFAGMQRLPWKGETYKYVSGSSFSSPYITSFIANIISDGIRGYTNIMSMLERKATSVVDVQTDQTINLQKEMSSKIKNIHKAITFPYNKEIHAVLGNLDLLKFEITNAYDLPQFGRVGKSLNELLYGKKVVNLFLLSYQEIDWESNFDTIILGHIKMITKCYHLDFIEYFLDKCIKYKKNIYSFDTLTPYSEKIKKIEENGNWAFAFTVSNDDISITTFGNLYKLSSPVLGIIGTSSKQGKFNLQLELRRKFLENGYNVGQLGTEPTSLLFGMDLMYPNGYGTSINLVQNKEVYYLNRELASLINRDIIIIGTQSQIIPYSRGNLGFYPFSQHNLLLASEPDVVVLCINPTDEIPYIERILEYLHSYFETSILAFVLYPFLKTYDWSIGSDNLRSLCLEEKIKTKTTIEKEFNIPVYVNGDTEDMKALYEQCICFFQEN